MGHGNDADHQRAVQHRAVHHRRPGHLRSDHDHDHHHGPDHQHHGHSHGHSHGSGAVDQHSYSYSSAEYIEHPLAVARLGEARMIVFPDGQGSALVLGNLDDVNNEPLVRLQSACQYGEIYGSLECDCRAQLDASLAAIGAEGAGVVVHLLAHEGRGAGLRAKAHAYHDRHYAGIDTFDSYKRQGLPDDERNYDVAIEFLKKHLDLHRIRLLTNNPNKVDAVAGLNIQVERIPLLPVLPADGPDAPICSDYLIAKAGHGHMIPLPGQAES